MSAYRCIAGCEGDLDLFTPHFACPRCGGLVDVVHDEQALARHGPETWRQRLAARASSADPLDRSGVWRFREWVMPDLSPDEVVTAGEGLAPLMQSAQLARYAGVGRLAVKQCGHALTGSFKDLGMTVLVSMARAMKRRGKPVRALVCASTGDTSAALAAYGAMAELPVIVLLPQGKISMAQLVQPLAAGAHVRALDGDFDDCMRVVQELVAEPGMFLANSKNPLRLEGQKTVAFEIAQQRGYRVPDFVVIPSGNLGNVAALHAGFRLLRALGLTARVPRLVAAQVDAANPLYRAFRAGLSRLDPVVADDTHATAIRIGDPVSWPRARIALQQSDGVVVSVSESALLDAGARADRAGLFCCPHTAAAIAGCKRLVDEKVMDPGADVVVVSTAHGLKFADQKVRFHQGQPAVDGIAPSAVHDVLRGRPLRVAARTRDVLRSLDEVLP